MTYLISENKNGTYSVIKMTRDSAGRPSVDRTVAVFIDRGRNAQRKSVEELVRELNTVASQQEQYFNETRGGLALVA